MINIIKTKFKWNGTLSVRKATNKILTHHAAWKSCGVMKIHKAHQSNGWAGIGYHFLVRKNGKIYEGRPINTVGAHCTGENSDSIGICFEGDFTTDTMTNKQLKAGQELIAYLVKLYGLSMSDVYRHKDFMATACPGKNFPFDKLKKGTSSLQVGDKVKIKSGAKDLNTKKKYSAWVYKTTYTVIRINGNEVVFGLNGAVTGKCLKKYVKEV